jgi:hypothetical protein
MNENRARPICNVYAICIFAGRGAPAAWRVRCPGHLSGQTGITGSLRGSAAQLFVLWPVVAAVGAAKRLDFRMEGTRVPSGRKAKEQHTLQVHHWAGRVIRGPSGL